jgi:hypothetical protein
MAATKTADAKGVTMHKRRIIPLRILLVPRTRLKQAISVAINQRKIEIAIPLIPGL